MHDPNCRRRLEASIEQLNAIPKAINQIDEVTDFIASHDEESLDVGLASLIGTSAIGARAIFDCQFRRLSPKNRSRLAANLDLLIAELDKHRRLALAQAIQCVRAGFGAALGPDSNAAFVTSGPSPHRGLVGVSEASSRAAGLAQFSYQ